MISHLTSLNPNRIVQYLKKPAEEFTRQDLIKFISENEIKMVNFRYVGGDGRLKKLNFSIHSIDHLQIDPALRENITWAEYESGHMMYVNLPDLKKLQKDLEKFLKQ